MKSIILLKLATITLMIVGVFFLSLKNSSSNQILQFNHNKYTFYQIEIEWPGSICKFKNCNKADLVNFNGSHFNLHGVWPTGVPDNQCEHVNNCQNLPYDNSIIAPQVMADLDQYWTGLYNHSKTFRQHEWEKHGVCWNDRYSKGFLQNNGLAVYMNDYFNFALSIIKKYEPLNDLSQYGIDPSEVQSYQYQKIINLLKPKFGEGISGKCQIVNGKQYLHSIDFCLGLNQDVIDCPCSNSKKSNCNTATPIYIGEFVMPSQ